MPTSKGGCPGQFAGTDRLLARLVFPDNAYALYMLPVDHVRRNFKAHISLKDFDAPIRTHPMSPMIGTLKTPCFMTKLAGKER